MKYKLTDIQLAGNHLVDDAKSTLELLNEYYHNNITMSFSHARAGYAKMSSNHIVIPNHAINGIKTSAYTIYYVIHEFVHCHFRIWNHGTNFKRNERRLLDMFGLSITYSRAYPKALQAFGQEVYHRKNKINKEM